MNTKKNIPGYFEKAFILLIFLCLASVFSNKAPQDFKSPASHIEAGLSHNQALLPALPLHVIQLFSNTAFNHFVFVNKKSEHIAPEKTKDLDKKYAAIKPFVFKGFVVQPFIPKSEDPFPSA